MTKKTVLFISIIIFASLCKGQTSETKFYLDRDLKKEVSRQRANYSRTIVIGSDGTTSTEVVDIKKNELILKNGEPFGIWTIKTSRKERKLDYNFELNYTTKECEANVFGLMNDDYFYNHTEFGYIAPKIASGESSFTQYLRDNIHYPKVSREAGVSGTVYVLFTITKNGEIKDTSVVKGVEINLDKEAMRVVRELKISEPPMLDDESIDVCITIPIKFVLL
jgi:TonB family protein